MGVTGDRAARAGGECEMGLPLCSVAVTTLSGVGPELTLFFSSPHTRTFAPEKGNAKASGAPYADCLSTASLRHSFWCRSPLSLTAFTTPALLWNLSTGKTEPV